MAKNENPMKVTDMDRAYGVKNALSGYSGPSTAKQQQDMIDKYGAAPAGKQLWAINDGKAEWKTPEEAEAASKDFLDYNTPEGRAYFNQQLESAKKRNEAEYLNSLKPKNTAVSPSSSENSLKGDGGGKYMFEGSVANKPTPISLSSSENSLKGDGGGKYMFEGSAAGNDTTKTQPTTQQPTSQDVDMLKKLRGTANNGGVMMSGNQMRGSVSTPQFVWGNGGGQLPVPKLPIINPNIKFDGMVSEGYANNTTISSLDTPEQSILQRKRKIGPNQRNPYRDKIEAMMAAGVDPSEWGF
jgi:hypothetical protein